MCTCEVKQVVFLDHFKLRLLSSLTNTLNKLPDLLYTRSPYSELPLGIRYHDLQEHVTGASRYLLFSSLLTPERTDEVILLLSD